MVSRAVTAAVGMELDSTKKKVAFIAEEHFIAHETCH